MANVAYGLTREELGSRFREELGALIAKGS
jgi:hypothetical protein